MVSRLSLFRMIALVAMSGPIPPLPLRPWHLAQTPLNSCSPRSDVPSACACASAESQLSNCPAGTASTVAVIAACWIPQNSAHWPMYLPGLAISNHVWFGWPGMASILPPSAGIHQLWITSSSGAVTSSLTGRFTGARMVSIAMTPFGYVYCQ